MHQTLSALPVMTSWLSELDSELALRQQQGLYRSRLELQSPQGASIKVNGREYINFSSNDYLGLANHPTVVEAFHQGAQQYGVGAGASHLIVGHHQPHQQLEQAIAQLTGRDRALVFSSGYMANLGVIHALLGNNDLIIEDKLNHASLIDAGRGCGAKLLRYRHNDLGHLEQLLQEHLSHYQNRRILLAVDGVFSMDGDIAPLDKLATLCSENNIALMVDDAHGFGVLGKSGGGCAQHFDLSQTALPVVMGTMGKALGVAGAFVAGSEALIETLIQFARTYIYTTALPPACASAALASLQLLQNGDEQQVLRQRIEYFRGGIKSLDIDVPDSQTAIQPLIVGEASDAVALSEALRQQGLLVSAIRPPTVPMGTARLRIALSAAHTEEHIDRLLSALCQFKTSPGKAFTFMQREPGGLR